jgi:RimJ/RimL family protein N-acetyltransferase
LPKPLAALRPGVTHVLVVDHATIGLGEGFTYDGKRTKALTHFTVAIRPYQPGDAPLLYEAARESIAEIYPWLPWCHPGYTLQDSEKWLETCLAEREAGRAFDFAVYDESTQLFLGVVAINQLHPVPRFANLGYWVRSSCTGHGVAVAAVRLCAQFGFDELKLKRLEILTAAGNVRSQRVAEKAGAKREGLLRQRLNIGEVWHDAVVFSLIPEDLKPVIV